MTQWSRLSHCGTIGNSAALKASRERTWRDNDKQAIVEAQDVIAIRSLPLIAEMRADRNPFAGAVARGGVGRRTPTPLRR